jgi:type II secretory pathway pseudopilin PulG
LDVQERAMSQRTQRCGFALVELMAVVVCVVLIASVLLVMGEGARRQARIGEDLSNLRRIGALTQSYGADFNDLMWSFSWRPGNYVSPWPDLQSSATDLGAGANQAVAIMRKLSGNAGLPPVSLWVPHIGYSHLVLADYADERAPVRWVVSSGDRHRLKWIEDPACFRLDCFAPYQPSSFGHGYIWLYSASFRLPTAFYDRSPVPHRISQAGTQNMNSFWVSIDAQLHGQQLAQIAHPSAKVMMHDDFSWHFGTRKPVFLLPEARVSLLFSDGAATVKKSADANPGWINPNSPNHPTTVTPWYKYQPSQAWEPPALTGSSDIGFGYYRWTRMGVKGRDYGGPEVFP